MCYHISVLLCHQITACIFHYLYPFSLRKLTFPSGIPSAAVFVFLSAAAGTAVIPSDLGAAAPESLIVPNIVRPRIIAVRHSNSVQKTVIFLAQILNSLHAVSRVGIRHDLIDPAFLRFHTVLLDLLHDVPDQSVEVWILPADLFDIILMVREIKDKKYSPFALDTLISALYFSSFLNVSSCSSIL